MEPEERLKRTRNGRGAAGCGGGAGILRGGEPTSGDSGGTFSLGGGSGSSFFLFWFSTPMPSFVFLLLLIVEAVLCTWCPC